MDVRQRGNRTQHGSRQRAMWRAAVALACTLAHPALAGAAEPAAEPPDAREAKTATASAITLSGLPEAVRERLEDRTEALGMMGRSTVSQPMRFTGDTLLISRMLGQGYADVDAFVIPMRDVGSAPLVLRFEPRTDDARAEGIALFLHLLPEIKASGVAFVAIRDSVARPETSGDRYRWLLWNTPDDEWVLLKEDPDTFFEQKLAALRGSGTPAPALEVAYITRRAHIEFTRGRRHSGATMMRDALRVIDAQPAASPVPPGLQVEVLQALLYQAASEDDEADLGELIRRYVELAARVGISISSQPVRMSAPGIPAAIPRDGFVDLAFDVLEDGRVAAPRVTETNMHSASAARVAKSLEQWRFLPAVEGGVAVRSERTWRFTFERLD